ncbi:hypothetical protein JoomaDRAFT_2070 [Galbibacter orientalis DSM 19592]|uniref:Uncharacterized protein n=1 Tax=Galbibacter orientalis DSM 19592 TaxID=926559 RepID=I3C621_9FLAO|nr:hypothetical protein [Galbibacter orientalis]EIJ39064.1 hypothetical protein JoomaDRAFT_2070 [Galbibacter orientalis DSM 19592]
MSKKITITELLELIPQKNESKKYLSWEKLDLNDFNDFNLVGEVYSNSDNQTEFSTKENYWSENYPIALDFFPNSRCEVYTDNINYYLVYRDFGGHVPERRCRLIRRELII